MRPAIPLSICLIGISLVYLLTDHSIETREENLPDVRSSIQEVRNEVTFKPSGFLENKGQWEDASIRFLLEKPGLSVILGEDYIFYKLDYFNATSEGNNYFNHHVKVLLEGANRQSKVVIEGKSQDDRNYFLGGAPTTDVHHYQKVVYEDVYPGIDLVFEAYDPENEKFGFKYSFIVHPHANPDLIQLKYDGQEDLTTQEKHLVEASESGITEINRLAIHTSGGIFGEELSQVYTLKGGIRTAVDAAFKVVDKRNVRIKLDEYSKKETLVIDPEVVSVVLRRATYYGSEGTDRMNKVDLVDSGIKKNIVVIGTTSGTLVNLSTPSSIPMPFDTAINGNNDMIIAKFSPDLSKLLTATYYGGDGEEDGLAISYIDDGNIIIGGYTSSTNLPLDNSDNDNDNNYKSLGGEDMVVASFDSTLSTLNWVFTLGGAENERVNDLIFHNNQIFAVGTAASENLQTDEGRPLSKDENTSTPASDAIVASINAQKGTSDWIITSNWISYYGNDRADEGNGITAFDNKVYITGQIIEGTRDDKSFVAEFEANNGNIRATKSYTDFGSKSNDIAINSDGSLLALSGVIEANHDGLTGISNGAQTTYGGGDSDGILLVVNTNDLSINWSSYLGGNNNDNLLTVTFDCNNNVLAAGNSRSTSNISTDLLYNSYNGGGNGENDTGDAIMVKFSESGEQLWWYYFGDKADERAFDLSLGENGEILLVGETSSQDGITTQGLIDPVYDEIYIDKDKGGNVGFISTFCDLIIDEVPRGLTVPLGGEASFSIGTNFCGMINSYTWTKDEVLISNNSDVGFGSVKGSATAKLDIESVTLASEGEYCVILSTTCGTDTLCASLDVVSLEGTGVCLDQESSLNLPGVNQQTIELTFPDLEANDTISNASYTWSVTAESGDPDGANDVIAGSVGNFPETLPLTRANLHNISIMPTASGTYTYRLDFTYEDSRRNPTTVTDFIEKTITVDSFPTLLDDINDPPNEICEGEEASFSLKTDVHISSLEVTRIDGNTDLTENGFDINISGSSVNLVFNSFDNPTTQSIKAEYEIIPTSNRGCLGPANTLIITVFPNPKLEIQVDKDTICSGQNVSIDFSALSSPDDQSNDETEITWTRLANPGISNEPGNPVTVSNSGTIDEILTNSTDQVQTVTYQLEGLSNGCDTTQTISIAVLPEAQLNFNTGEVTGCSGDNFMLDLGITTRDMPAQLEVIFQDNPNIEGDVGGTFSLDANSTVDVAYILTNPTNTERSVMATITPYFVVEDAVECRGKSEDFEFIVYPIPSLTNGTLNICENVDFSFDLNALSNGVSGTSFDWSIFSSTDNVNGALSGRGSTISQKLSLNDGIEGEVVYEVSASAAGCVADPSFITITVLGEPEISFSTDPVTAEICDTDASPVTITTSFTGTSLDNINSIQWFQGDKILTGETNQKLQVSEAGVYKIEVESKGGCVVEDSIEIVEVERASVSITAPAMSETCVNSDFTLETEITAGVADSYQWLQDGVEIAGATSETLVVNSEGNYQVVVNGSGTCPDTSSVVNLSFFPQPIPTYEVVDAVCPNSVLNLSGRNDNSNAIIAQVEWSVTGDLPLPVFSSPNNLTTDLEFGENQSGTDREYQVMLKLTTANGCVDSLVQSVTNDSRPLIAFNFDSQNCPDTISLGTQETLNATGYSWEILTNQDSVAISDPTSANPKFIVSNAGNQTLEIEVKLTATNDANCEDASIQVLTVSPKPQLEIGKDATSGCPGDFINLTSNGSDPGEGLSFSKIAWTANGDTIGDGTDTSLALVNNGVTDSIYQIILRGENTTGCSSQDTIEVTAHPNAESQIVLDPDDSTSACAPFTINETIISLVDHQEANTENYSWKVVDSEGMVIVSSVGIVPPTYEITTPGTQITYRLTANSLNGCEEDEATIVFKSFPEIKADFSLPEETICGGDTVTFTNSSTNAASFLWNFGDGSTSSVASPSHVFENTSFTEDATYQVKLTATSSDGCSDTFT
ncbi:MAG: PKD-like domain-containing protein, partial [Bacteroidota bacterium]